MKINYRYEIENCHNSRYKMIVQITFLILKDVVYSLDLPTNSIYTFDTDRRFF